VLGAIIGDIAGSVYEFAARQVPVLDGRELFGLEANYTDDTLMTLAVYKGLSNAGGDPANGPQAVAEAMRLIGTTLRPLGKGGFGQGFARWLVSSDPKPYNSCGNGSAMRVSSVGWMFPTLELTEQWAQITAAVTHNHPEGIKGAQATAASIFLARTGCDKQQIKTYVESRFGYDLSRSWADVSSGDNSGTTCQVTVPQALSAFLRATTFEETIRLAISLGWDTDTRAAIAGSVAEAYYGIYPDTWRDAARSRLAPPLAGLLDRFKAETIAQRMVALLAPYYGHFVAVAAGDADGLARVPGTARLAHCGLVGAGPLEADLCHFDLMDYEGLVFEQQTRPGADLADALDPARADAAHLASILCWHVKGERHAEGVQTAALRDGTFAAITRRAFELAGMPPPAAHEKNKHQVGTPDRQAKKEF